MYTKRKRKQIRDKTKKQEPLNLWQTAHTFYQWNSPPSPRIMLKKTTYSSNKKILFIFEAYGENQESQRKDYTIVMASARV